MAVSVGWELATLKETFEASSFFVGNQYGPQVVMLDDGGLALSYGSAFGLLPLLNKFDPQYARQGSHLLPHVVTPADLQSAPAMTKLADGRLAVVWVEGPAATNATRAVIVDPETFTIDVPEFAVFGFAGTGEPSLATLTNGNWVATRRGPGDDIFIQVMTPSGFGIGTAKVIDGSEPNAEPKVAALKGGGFVVVWHAAGLPSVFAAIFDNAGNFVREPYQISGSVSFATSPVVAALSSGGFAVAYLDAALLAGGISFETRDAAGNSDLPRQSVSQGTLTESDLDIAELENGYIVVNHSESGTIPGGIPPNFESIWQSIYKSDGTLVFRQSHDFESDRASQGSIEALGAGRYAVAWRDNPDSGGNDGVSMRISEVKRTSTSDGDSDEIIGDALRDRMEGNGGDDRLFGMGADDVLIGGDGNDTLDGGTNPEIGQLYAQGDIMLGGAGDDTYFVDSPLDLVDEGFVFPGFGFGGIDSIFSRSDFYWDTQSVGENVFVEPSVNDIGGDGVTVVGGIFNNTLLGHAGTDIFFGRGGSDVYRGGDGVDWYSLSTLGLTDANAYAGVNGFNTVIVQERKSGPLSYDIVFEFEPGRDKIDLSDYSFIDGITDGAEYIARAVNDGLGNCYIALGDGLDYLYMVGLEKAELRAGDFIV